VETVLTATAALNSFPSGGLAVVLGARGGIGAALVEALEATQAFGQVLGYTRQSIPALDLKEESSVAAVAAQVRQRGTPRLIIDATGVLHGPGMQPEKALQAIDPQAMAEAFAINAIGPALLMKHLLPLLPAEGKAVFATLSARVGSIGDNRLGGWYSYRASKAALNQLVRTAAIELQRRRPQALCIALHPGTVDTALSAPFARGGLEIQSPAMAALGLLETLDRASAGDNGSFLGQRGERLPW
jgi:NAD(P)-dependent dehydrogenase (short-subunit alcohol dehydrogenase family)